MRAKREYIDYLRDILDAAEKAGRFVQGTDFETFQRNDEKVFAVIRALEIIGEAGKKIPPAIRKRYPETHGLSKHEPRARSPSTIEPSDDTRL